jgi:hypothetical protein
MNTAKLLKTVANTLVAANIAKLVAGDMAKEARSDAAAIQSSAIRAVGRRPYRAVVAAATLGLCIGLILHALGQVAALSAQKKT